MVIILIKIAIMIKHAISAKINISEVHGFSLMRRNVVALT